MDAVGSLGGVPTYSLEHPLPPTPEAHPKQNMCMCQQVQSQREHLDRHLQDMEEAPIEQKEMCQAFDVEGKERNTEQGKLDHLSNDNISTKTTNALKRARAMDAHV